MRKRVMDDRPCSLPLTIKSGPGLLPHPSDPTAQYRKSSHPTARPPGRANPPGVPFSLSHLGRMPR